MRIGTPKEILGYENRVALTPAWTRTLVELGHEVYIETNAGLGSSFHDEDYVTAGASIIGTAAEVFNIADLIVKVKQPLDEEIKLVKANQMVFTYLHLAGNPGLGKKLEATGAHFIAYETIEDNQYRLPLLRPMSEIAGRLAPQIGARFLERSCTSKNPGRGLLLGGASGVPQGTVTIIGAGIVGTAALKIAVGLGAYVNIIDTNFSALGKIDEVYGSRITSIYSTTQAIENAVINSDLVIGAVLIAGKKAPRLVTEDMVKRMRYGSVIIDVAVDQGGCVETCEVTSHDQPIIIKHDVLHYGVPNMPSIVPNTSTQALCNSTMPYIMKLAKEGLKALDDDPGFKKGLNVSAGKVLIET
jgi:alanine dehydrogenase